MTEFKFIGGDVCLDFANTADGCRAALVEMLRAYQDLLDWSVQADLITTAHARKLAALARKQPDHAAAVLQRAVTLREATFRAFQAIIDGKPPPKPDLDVLNQELARTTAGPRVVASPDALHWDWQDDARSLDVMLGPVARSAALLLTSPDLKRVRICSSDECDWLFLDETKNRSRRWCDMKVCGNRAKVRAHRMRQPSAKSSPAK